jgi:hypothetical protein
MGPFVHNHKGALSFLCRSSLLDYQAIKNDESSRAFYLERENARLQRLVAELLVKNEQLRQRYVASLTPSTTVTDSP